MILSVHLKVPFHFQAAISRKIVSVEMSIQMLVGIAVIILGILSLIGFQPIMLSLIALLTIGATLLLTAAAYFTLLYTIRKK
jgi:hypothetical protein